MSPIALQLRERAKEYRAKGCEGFAEELEREAADAEFVAKAFGGPVAPVAPATPAPKKRSSSFNAFKPGTRQPEKKPDVVTGETPWWAKVKPGESMTAAAEQEKARMSSSKMARRVHSSVIE